MFVLYTINNILVIKPSDLVGGSNEILYKTLQAKYLFKVNKKTCLHRLIDQILEGEGLCVELASFTIKECVIVNGQGDYQYDVFILTRQQNNEIGGSEACNFQST